jgi:phosphate uptake regulator
MNTNTLNAIERSLTRLLAQAQATKGPTSADDTDQITQAVAILKKECDALLAKALPSSKDLRNVAAGIRMSENIDPALDTFRSSQPYSSLSNDEKVMVLEMAKREYKSYYDNLRRQDLQDPWGKYVRKTYDTLVDALSVEYIRLSKL